MRTYHSNEIGTIAILGHSGSGKTSVVEAMAYRAGITTRRGKIEEGNTISDYNQEEINRQSSVSLSIVPIEWNNCKLNMLDTPGAFDFSGEVDAAIKVCESALIVVPATAGVSVGTKQAMHKAEDKAKMIYINGIDNPNANYQDKLDELRDMYGAVIAPLEVPIMDNNKMVGYVNVTNMEARFFDGDKTVEGDIPENLMSEINPVKEMIDEAVANTDDDLLEKYIMEEPFTEEEISGALREGVMNRQIIPVLCGTNQIGIQNLLNSMVSYFSSAADTCNSFTATHVDTNEEEVIGYNEDLPASLFVFKTIADPFVGRISLFKVMTGQIKTGMTLYNPDKDENEKVNKLYVMRGKELIETDTLCAGDIGALSKLNYTQTNDTLCANDFKVSYEPIEFPTPYYGKAIKAIGKSNEEKITNAINRILEEDKTLIFESNQETKQQCLYGLGDIHIDTVVSKLKTRFKIEVGLDDIIIPYRETIRGSITQRKKYKKQSGGHGQYGDVEIVFEPLGNYDKPYEFEEKIFGGVVPKGYFPAVEKGLAEACQTGVLAGYPVLGIKATLVDGSYHPVDSSEMAFKTATVQCFREAIPKAKPAILEPYVTLHVYVDEQYTGDIMGQFNKKRARVLGSENLDDGTTMITAEAPQAEVMNYAVDLRSMTQGQGFFDMEFLDYEFTNELVQNKIIESRKNS